MKFQYQSPEAVASHVQSNQRVFIQGSAATPVRLAEALLAQKDRLHQVELVSITLQGIEFCETDMGDHFLSIRCLYRKVSERLSTVPAVIMYPYF